jgi:hypothetical protein
MTAQTRTRRLLAAGVAAAVTGTGALVATPVAQAADPTTGVRAQAAAPVASTTVLTVEDRTPHYGEPVEATATVTAPGATPAGRVTFVLDGSATAVDTDERGVATLVLDDTKVGDHTLSATFVAADPAAVQGSASGPQTLVVRKAPTRTRVAVTGERVGERTRARVRVGAKHETLPTGRVWVVLRKVGRPGSAELRYGALLEGRRGFHLGLLDAGRYKVRALYRGDKSHRRSADVVRFRVRR